MPKVQLGKIRIAPITEVFENENDFSEWLKENIAILGEKTPNRT